MKLNNMNKKYTKKYSNNNYVCISYNTNNKNGFYTKIIAFVMCNVTNLSTKPSAVKVSCQMRRRCENSLLSGFKV